MAYSSTMGRPMDTSADMHRKQLEALQSMTPAQRLRLADEMSSDVRALAEAGKRERSQSPETLEPRRR